MLRFKLVDNIEPAFTADDFIVATGDAHTVGEFAGIAFRVCGLDWKEHVVENRALLHRQRPVLTGDASKLRAATGWKPSVTFEEGLSQTIDWYLENKEWLKHVTSGEYQQYYEVQYKQPS